jgi:hypothetical protein
MLLFNKTHPIKGYAYAITTGTYAGQIFVYVETTKGEHGFLSLPEMVIRNVPEDKFKFGLNTKIIDIVERLPKNIYTMCTKQYRKNKTAL